MPRRRAGHRCAVFGYLYDGLGLSARRPACPDVEGTVAGLRNLVLGMRAEAEGKDPHEAVAAANGEDAAEDEGADEGADEGDAPVDAEPVSDATAEPVPTEPQGVPNFDDEPQVAIDTEGAVAENHEASAAVFGGAATVPAGPAHEGGLPLVDGAGEDPGATVAMPAMPQE
ncbi:MAG: hypothetical protein ACLS89_04705 [Collinsella sp.]